MSDKFELDIYQGKYRYTYESGKQTVLRHGEPWPSMDQELVGNKFGGFGFSGVQALI